MRTYSEFKKNKTAAAKEREFAWEKIAARVNAYEV